MKVLCIGNSNIEITCPIDGQVNEGTKLNITEKYECGGGNAGNIAYLFGKWGVETYIGSLVGADDFASKIKKEYETIGVKTDFIETAYDKGTSQKIILINKTNKNNTILDLHNNSFLKKYAFNIEPDLVISDGSDLGGSLAAFDKYPHATTFLSVTVPTKETIELCKYVKYIIFNKSSAELLTNVKIDFNDSSTLVNAYNSLKQRFSKAEIIITLGERGCVYSVNANVKIMPPIRVQVIDTNGAGSVFVGAFSYAMGRNFGLEKSIAYANIAASLSTTKYTCRLSIPSLVDVSNYYDDKFGSNNNPNNQENNEQINMQISNSVNQNSSMEVKDNVNS